MGFGEEPERGPHDECAFEIHILKSKLAERDAEIGRLTKTLSNQGAIMDKRQSERGEIVARLEHFGITGEDLVGCVADLGVQRDRARAINDAIAKMPDVFERAGVGDGSVVDAVAAVIGALVCAERGNSDLANQDDKEADDDS